MPFSPAELYRLGEPINAKKLLSRGGFPEPYLAEDNVAADRWRMQYIDGLVRNDILDFEKIHDFRAIQVVFELLRSRVGSPLSYQSISEDVGISPNTVKTYVQIFESLFIIFRITPHSRNIARSILKEPKVYFYDTGLVDGDEGVRFARELTLEEAHNPITYVNGETGEKMVIIPTYNHGDMIENTSIKLWGSHLARHRIHKHGSIYSPDLTTLR